MKKQSIKRGIWYIDKRCKRQKGCAFPLVALAAPILGNLCGIISKKYLERKYDDDADMVRDKTKYCYKDV